MATQDQREYIIRRIREHAKELYYSAPDSQVRGQLETVAQRQIDKAELTGYKNPFKFLESALQELESIATQE